MVAISGTSYGPLTDDLLRRQVDVDIVDGVVEIYYERELRARFDKASGDRLPLDDSEEPEESVELGAASEQLLS